MNARKILKITAYVLLFTVVFIILGGVFAVFLITKDTNLANNDLTAISANLHIKSADGEELEYYSGLKSEVKYEEISPYIIHSFVALEDKRFYEHNGLDYRRILGAAINNVKAGYMKEGGSTITQQLAKNAILTNEKTLVRKLKEAKLARAIEKEYSKDEIITLYLNTIYFGHSLYGVKAACKRLFDKSPSEVTLSEAAILAGIVKNPLKNSPLNSIENALTRRDLVLKLMFEQGYISESERDEALKENYFIPSERKANNTSSSYTEAVIAEASNALGITSKDLIIGGYTIATYYQSEAQDVLNAVYASAALNEGDADRLLLLGDNISGGIVAYISSVSITPESFRRQPASTIKPIMTYASAFESGRYALSTPIEDKQYDFNGYSPKNYQNSYLGWTDIKTAITTSSNACAVKIVDELGLDYSKKLASACGLSFDDRDGLASALGGMTYGVTPIEITEAYMTMANSGIHKKLHFVSKIYDKSGKTVYYPQDLPYRAMSEATAYLLTDALCECAKSGTASKLWSLGYDIAAKTGTAGNAEGNTDAWNMSYTVDYTLCSWYGANGGTMPGAITGGSFPSLQARYVHKALGKPQAFRAPIGIIRYDIDKYCMDNYHILKLASDNTPYEYRQSALFAYDNLPEISDFFDNSLPTDFAVRLTGYDITVSLTASDKFDYRIMNLNGKEIYKIPKKSGYNEVVIPATDIGIDGYYIEARTDEGVYIAESPPQIVFIWY